MGGAWTHIEPTAESGNTRPGGHFQNQIDVLFSLVVGEDFFVVCHGKPGNRTGNRDTREGNRDTQSAEINRQKIGGEIPLLSKG